MIVKVILPTSGNEQQARVVSKDQSIAMMVPVDQVAKRFAHGERVGFFNASIKPNIGVLEIGERLVDGDW